MMHVLIFLFITTIYLIIALYKKYVSLLLTLVYIKLLVGYGILHTSSLVYEQK